MKTEQHRIWQPHVYVPAAFDWATACPDLIDNS